MMRFSLPAEFPVKRSDLLTALALVAVVKVVMFVFFTLNYQQVVPLWYSYSPLAFGSGDTDGYLIPIESWVNGEGYNTMCRMPGLLPIYAPMYALLGPVDGRSAFAVFQLLADVLQVVVLAHLVARFTQSMRGFWIALFLFAFSTFISARSNMMLSDTISSAWVLFSLFFLLRAADRRSRLYFLIGGIFLAWSVFMRPIGLVFYVPAGLLIWGSFHFRISASVRPVLIFALPLVILTGSWTAWNYSRSGRFVPLQAPFDECFGYITQEHLAFRELIIHMGEDYMSWSRKSAAAWFFRDTGKEPEFNPFDESDFTSIMTYDSLLQLRRDFFATNHVGDSMQCQLAKADVVRRIERYDASLRDERPMHYYFLNRVELLLGFVFPSRLDDLPFPALNKMKWYHKIIKGGSYVGLIAVNVLGLFAWFRAFRRKNLPMVIVGLIPVMIILILGPVLGFVEQRYLVPAYPVLVMMLIWAGLDIFSRRPTAAGVR
jgi:hypothetical protein